MDNKKFTKVTQRFLKQVVVPAIGLIILVASLYLTIVDANQYVYNAAVILILVVTGLGILLGLICAGWNVVVNFKNSKR